MYVELVLLGFFKIQWTFFTAFNLFEFTIVNFESSLEVLVANFDFSQIIIFLAVTFEINDKVRFFLKLFFGFIVRFGNLDAIVLLQNIFIVFLLTIFIWVVFSIFNSRKTFILQFCFFILEGLFDSWNLIIGAILIFKIILFLRFFFVGFKFFFLETAYIVGIAILVVCFNVIKN